MTSGVLNVPVPAYLGNKPVLACVTERLNMRLTRGDKLG